MQYQSNSNQPLNVDEIKIGGGRPKTFEELLEENLRKMGQDTIVQPTTSAVSNDDESFEKPQKKEFLKRKSQKTNVVAPSTKKYNYYVDNFDESKPKAPDKMEFSSKNEEPFQTQQKHPIIMESQPINPYNRSVSPMLESNPSERLEQGKSSNKKRFLTRGSGTAGGIKGR